MKKLIILMAGLFVLYPLSYFWLYDKTACSWDTESLSMKRGAFKLSPKVRIPGDLSIYGPRRTFIDDIYWPMVWLGDVTEGAK